MHGNSSLQTTTKSKYRRKSKASGTTVFTQETEGMEREDYFQQKKAAWEGEAVSGREGKKAKRESMVIHHRERERW